MHQRGVRVVHCRGKEAQQRGHLEVGKLSMSTFSRIWHVSHHFLGQTDVSPCWSELPGVKEENVSSFRECSGVFWRLQSETPVSCMSACCESVQNHMKLKGMELN